MTQRRHAMPVEEYLASKPAAVRHVLERVRRAIRRAVPGAEERISYGVPAYTLHGGVVLYFAGWTRHYSLYPAKGPVAAAFQNDLARYEVDNGTIRFPLSEPVPAALIERIARFRAEVAGGRRRTRAPAKRAGQRRGLASHRRAPASVAASLRADSPRRP